MVQNFQDESCFLFSTVKAENNDGIHIILKWYLIQTELYSVPNKVMLKVCEDWIQEVLGLDFTVKCFILKTQDDLPNEL